MVYLVSCLITGQTGIYLQFWWDRNLKLEGPFLQVATGPWFQASVLICSGKMTGSKKGDRFGAVRGADRSYGYTYTLFCLHDQFSRFQELPDNCDNCDWGWCPNFLKMWSVVWCKVVIKNVSQAFSVAKTVQTNKGYWFDMMHIKPSVIPRAIRVGWITQYLLMSVDVIAVVVAAVVAVVVLSLWFTAHMLPVLVDSMSGFGAYDLEMTLGRCCEWNTST